MSMITNLWYNWSTYEKLQEGVLLLGILVVSLIAIYFITKNRQLLMISAAGFLISAVLNVVGLFIVNNFFKITVTEVFKLVPILTSILLLSNIGILVGFYVFKKGKKGFHIETVIIEYLTDSSKQTVFLLLLASSIFLFVSVQTQAILVLSVLSCLASIWSMYWISKRILK